MKAWCQNSDCGEEFFFDESTGDGEFCSWECADAVAELERNTSDYDLAYGPRTVRRITEIRQSDHDLKVSRIRGE